MSDVQHQMDRLVTGFVARVTELARIAARDMIDQALDHPGRRRLPAVRRVRSQSDRRTGADLDKLAMTFLAFVSKRPGLRIEQITAQLGTRTPQLRLPIRKLIAEGALKTKGATRSRTYFATGR